MYYLKIEYVYKCTFVYYTSDILTVDCITYYLLYIHFKTLQNTLTTIIYLCVFRQLNFLSQIMNEKTNTNIFFDFLI